MTPAAGIPETQGYCPNVYALGYLTRRTARRGRPRSGCLAGTFSIARFAQHASCSPSNRRTQQRRDPAISVAAILAGKLDDVGGQRDLIIRCRGESSDASIGAGPMPGMLVSPRCQARSSHDLRMRGGGRGSEVSLCSLGQDQLVQRQIRDRPPEAAVLGLQLLQPLHLIHTHCAIDSMLLPLRLSLRPHPPPAVLVTSAK